MTTKLGGHDGRQYQISYGKRAVPVYRVYATPLQGITPIPESSFTGRTNELFAAEIDVEVLGNDFIPAYTRGDNSQIVATDSMKNYILQHALTYDGATLEGFLAHLGTGFIATYDQLRHLRLQGRELAFAAARVPAADGGFADSDALFARSDDDYATATVEVVATGGAVAVTDHECGRVGLRLMKLTGSSFTSFVRDGYTTLPDRRDRPLYVYLDVRWRYTDVADLLGEPATYVPAEQVRDVLRTVFHEFVSESIQHLVHEMGTRLLDRFPQLASVGFVAQNRTRDPFAVADDDRHRVYSDPFSAYGEITLRLTRSTGR